MHLTLLKRQQLADVIAAVLIFLFVYTAISKLIDIDSFKTVISKSPVLRESADLLSWLIPLGEIFVSLLLFMPNSRGYGLLFTSILLACFTLYIACMLLFAPHLPCSCGGVIQQMSWPQHLIFNTVFLLLSFLGWKIKRKLNKDFIAINRHSRIPV